MSPILNLLSFKRFTASDLTIRVSTSADGGQADAASSSAQISADGRYVIFESAASNLVAGDTNGVADIFRKDLVTGAIERISTAGDGTEAGGASRDAQISADGRYVLFESIADNLVAGDQRQNRYLPEGSGHRCDRAHLGDGRRCSSKFGQLQPSDERRRQLCGV
jgi:Tol biopolymer transport system component